MVGSLSARGGGVASDTPACSSAWVAVSCSAPVRQPTAGKYSTEVPQQGRIQADAGRTLGDSDLRLWTAVDVLPVVCKQGVRGSSPLSSTGQRHNSNGRGRDYSSKVQQPGPRQMPHTRSSGASPSRPAEHRSRVWAEFRAAEQGRTPSQNPAPPVQRSVGNVLNLRFLSWLLLLQRVSEWQAISVTQGEIPRGTS